MIPVPFGRKCDIPSAHPFSLDVVGENSGPPDGVVNLLNDVLGVIAQVGHSCN
ncbi:MAG: hypothetical protein IIB87_00420 [Chloroflexi bacterium]|nr:hypothetical protein [Chloroflexota bacterium]